MALTKKERTELGTRLARVINKITKWLNTDWSGDYTTDREDAGEKTINWRNSLIRIRRDFHLEFKDTEKKAK